MRQTKSGSGLSRIKLAIGGTGRSRIESAKALDDRDLGEHPDDRLAHAIFEQAAGLRDVGR